MAEVVEEDKKNHMTQRVATATSDHKLWLEHLHLTLSFYVTFKYSTFRKCPYPINLFHFVMLQL